MTEKAPGTEEMFGYAETEHKGPDNSRRFKHHSLFFPLTFFFPRTAKGQDCDRQQRPLSQNSQAQVLQIHKALALRENTAGLSGTHKQPPLLGGVSRWTGLDCRVLGDVTASIKTKRKRLFFNITSNVLYFITTV